VARVKRRSISPAQREFERLPSLGVRRRPASHRFMWRALAVLIIFIIIGLARG
jgi:hypothetical protein